MSNKPTNQNLVQNPFVQHDWFSNIVAVDSQVQTTLKANFQELIDSPEFQAKPFVKKAKSQKNSQARRKSPILGIIIVLLLMILLICMLELFAPQNYRLSEFIINLAQNR